MTMQSQVIESRASFVRWDGLCSESLGEALKLPTVECVEREIFESLSAARRAPQAAASLALVVTTLSAYRVPVTRAFIGALSERIPMSPDLSERIQVALQEAVTNAVLHGNLKVKST